MSDDFKQADLKRILAFLCTVPSRSRLRLILQLALAVELPETRRTEALAPLATDAPLATILQNNHFLMGLLEADDRLDGAEETVLLETMDAVGLVVPSSTAGIEALLEGLQADLVGEVEELVERGTVGGIPVDGLAGSA